MMLNERLHEFGILIAIGMKKRILALIVVMEMIMMSIVGVILGITAALPVVYYYNAHPVHPGGSWAHLAESFNIEIVIQPATDFSHFILQGYIVLSIAIILSLFAIYRIHKIKAMEAINS